MHDPEQGLEPLRIGIEGRRSTSTPALSKLCAEILVSRSVTRRVGSDALKVNGKIFAMISSKGKFVVKLPKNRVDEFDRSGRGPAIRAQIRGLMKEWIVLSEEASSLKLAREA
jgi:hypothetical protein